MVLLKSILIVVIAFTTIALGDFNYMQCQVSVADKAQSIPATDEQCAPCADGQLEWPCNMPNLCKCALQPPYPPPLPFQQKRDDLIKALKNIKLPNGSGGTISLGMAAICGLVGSAAVTTNYTFNYDYRYIDAEYGIFQMNYLLETAYRAYARDYLKLPDSIEAQVAFLGKLMDKYYDWSDISTGTPIHKELAEKFYNSMTNPRFNAEDQASNFLHTLLLSSPDRENERRAAARHYVLVNALPSNAADYTQCYTTVSNPLAPSAPTDEQCSICAEGSIEWPCNLPDLCKCIDTLPIPAPQFPWQQNRAQLVDALKNITLQTSTSDYV